jgi:hypothetical protein
MNKNNNIQMPRPRANDSPVEHIHCEYQVTSSTTQIFHLGAMCNVRNHKITMCQC